MRFLDGLAIVIIGVVAAVIITMLLYVLLLDLELTAILTIIAIFLWACHRVSALLQRKEGEE